MVATYGFTSAFRMNKKCNEWTGTMQETFGNYQKKEGPLSMTLAIATLALVK